jgi:6-pyruvoyl-tetrahydropterin synthase
MYKVKRVSNKLIAFDETGYQIENLKSDFVFDFSDLKGVKLSEVTDCNRLRQMIPKFQFSGGLRNTIENRIKELEYLTQ